MSNAISVNGRNTIGLDLGDKYSHLLVLSPDGEILEEGRIRTTPEAFRARFSSLAPAVVALETGTHSPWASRLIEECGHKVLTGNARKLRLISQNDGKCDKADTELLARAARFDPKLMAPIKHRSKEAQADLALVRQRDALVGARTGIVNSIRGTMKSMGLRLSKCDARSFHNKVADEIPEELRKIVAPSLKSLKQLTESIAQLDKEVESLCEGKYAQATGKLRGVKGVGPLTALAFVLTVCDPKRFKASRDMGAYLGLVPRRQESGEMKPQLRITKAGDSLMRRLLVSSAQYILGPFGEDCDLKRFGEAIAARGGKNGKKRAVVAVARKLAVLMHRLWVRNEDYEPLRQGKAQARRKGRMAVVKN
jgi:transposase